MDLKDGIFELSDGVATYTMNRPDVRNALIDSIVADYRTVIARVQSDRDIRALVVTGAGGAFCAGGNIQRMKDGFASGAEVQANFTELHGWLKQFFDLPVPVIAAVDGPAFGGGLSLALGSDIVLATPGATFCAVFQRIGLVPDMAVLYSLVRAVGLQRAKELCYSARVMSAQEAQAMGIVMALHDPHELVHEAQALARRFTHASREALALTKSILSRSQSEDYDSLAAQEGLAQAICLLSDYHRDAVKRFLGKQPLPFNWEQLSQKKAAE